MAWWDLGKTSTDNFGSNEWFIVVKLKDQETIEKVLPIGVCWPKKNQSMAREFLWSPPSGDYKSSPYLGYLSFFYDLCSADVIKLSNQFQAPFSWSVGNPCPKSLILSLTAQARWHIQLNLSQIKSPQSTVLYFGWVYGTYKGVREP